MRDGQLRAALLTLFGLAWGLASCGGGGGGADTSAPQAQETINGIAVPPAPDASANAKTVAGIDSNANGIRDDVERRLASEFGTDAVAFQIATRDARLLQAALVSPSTTNKRDYIEHSRCVTEIPLLRRLDAQTLAALDTVERQQAYRALMFNVFVNLEGC